MECRNDFVLDDYAGSTRRLSRVVTGSGEDDSDLSELEKAVISFLSA